MMTAEPESEPKRNSKVAAETVIERVSVVGTARLEPDTNVEIGEKRSALSRGAGRWCRRMTAIAMLAAAAIALSAALGLFLGWASVVQLALVALVAYVFATGSWRWFYVAAVTAPRDLSALVGYAKLLLRIRHFSKNDMTLPEIFDKAVAAHPDKPCFLHGDRTWTYARVQEYSFRVANVFKAHGYRKGQAVGLLAANCPQYPAVWLGLARLGVVVPLINTNLRSKALLHSIAVGLCDAVVYDDEYEKAIEDVSGELSPSVSLYRWSPREERAASVDGSVKDLTALLEEASVAPTARSADLSYDDKLLYIYTSGTTGLPKAAIITHSRYIFMCGGIHYMCKLTAKDVVYTSLPFYHSAACITAIGQAIVFGVTVALRNKFSASNFIKDCIKYNATIANYIGEMCRYMLAVPPGPEDKRHKLRLLFGNGLRPQIWKQFLDRFNIPIIVEFYGATEGNANIVNHDGTIGAIGFVSRIIPSVYPIALIKVDEHTGEPVRDAKGLCQLCKPNEAGVFIGKIKPDNPTRAFLGYVDKSASEKKVIRNVFTHGDSAFISGDILVSDEFGYLYFKDRTGDTFRWRGENVSTNEVEGIVSQIIDHRDAVVYGVLIPHIEGRAGMCGIADPAGDLDLSKLSTGLARDLPPYARPIFLRILKQVDMTGTFKMKKVDLQEDGFNPRVIKDKLYYLDAKTSQYVALTEEIYDKIVKGEIRL